jgi:L-fuconolactonase
MRLIDTHQHLWDLSRFDLPWTKGAGLPLERNHLPSDYDTAIRGTGIDTAVYMEVDVAVDQKEDEARVACARGPAVVGGNPAMPDFDGMLDRIAHPNLRGLRQVLHGGLAPGTCVSEPFVAGVRELGERQLLFDICIRPLELADGAKLASLCPDTQFVLDHCGNGNVRFTESEREQWKRGIEWVAKQPNTVCKISGIVASAKGIRWSADDLAPLVNHCWDTFGPDRVVFGSDWPVCTLAASLAEWVDALRVIASKRSEADRRKLFHENAIRIYRLPR